MFADHDWRTSPDAFPLGPALAKEVESLGRVLLQFYRAVNLLYRKSVEGKQPEATPAHVSLTNTSAAAFVSLATRFVAEEMNVT